MLDEALSKGASDLQQVNVKSSTKPTLSDTRKYPLRGYLLAPPGRQKRITGKENIILSEPKKTTDPEWPVATDGRTDGRTCQSKLLF